MLSVQRVVGALVTVPLVLRTPVAFWHWQPSEATVTWAKLGSPLKTI